MQAYNATIFREGQQHLSCEHAYEKPSFKLADYGMEDEIFGVISIPKLELEMPVYLGATYQHLADPCNPHCLVWWRSAGLCWCFDWH